MAIDKTIEVDGIERRVSVIADFPDLRDRIYEPSLIELPPEYLAPTGDLIVRNQLSDGACTGFALAAVINLQLHHEKLSSGGVSPRMLFEMAKFHDEWEGELYGWSSLRGAIKGFFHNGVCDETTAPFKELSVGHDGWWLSKEQAEKAKSIGLGAYYRLRPNIIDYHAALNEVGALAVSALTHTGWKKPVRGKIKPSGKREGGHAFAIIGYDADGFIVQNSWGEDWGGYLGTPGVGHWSYEDWAQNIVDAWVLRLAAPTPRAFGVVSVSSDSRRSIADAPIAASPRGYEVKHHHVHMDDGRLVSLGRYPTTKKTIEEMVENAADLANNDPKKKMKHVLIYAHGGLNGPKASARRIRAMKPVFLRNGIYPIHLMWDTGILSEVFDLLGFRHGEDHEMVGGLRDGFDLRFERASRGLGRKIWSEMKSGAAKCMAPRSASGRGLKDLFSGLQKLWPGAQFHFAGHSAGSILLGEMIRRRKSLLPDNLRPASFTLMAPACTTTFFEKHYRPALEEGFLGSLQQFNLNDKQEQDDKVTIAYGKSLLYLVSRAFDTKPDEGPSPILGMERYFDAHFMTHDRHPNHDIHTSGRRGVPTRAETHGGFDNDRTTMNHLLKTITGKAARGRMAFRESDLMGY